jgi:predicted Zn-ribbon and HTH transcriptional regulator
MKCDHCLYEWAPRVSDPKACPRCKARLDVMKKEKKV